jgi:NitT/TauT family transport system substrate-binding protein
LLFAEETMQFAIIWLLLISLIPDGNAFAQTKKVRMGIQSTNIGFLPFHVAYHKGFYREQGIDLETIFMSTQAVNAAFARGDIDYSAAVNGIIQTVVRGTSAKLLGCVVERPLQSFITKKEIRSARDLRGKRIAGSTAGGTATLMADLSLKHLGFESGRDVVIVPLRDNRLAALESGLVDAAILGVPENIIALDRGYNEILFVGDIVNYPQNGFGALTKKIQERPDEVYGMVRATLRGLLFALDPANRDEVIAIITKQWKLRDQRLAGEMLSFFGRGVAKNMAVSNEGIQLMIDLARKDANVAQPFTVAQVTDFSFLEKARRELIPGR